MPRSQYSHTPPGSDESLYRIMNYRLENCQDNNWEIKLHQEALDTTIQLREEKNDNFGQNIKLEIVEIVVGLILIGLAWLVGINPQTDVVDPSTDIHHASQHQERNLIKRTE